MDQRLQGPAVAAPPDWRGLCEELAREVQQYALEWDDEFPKCLVRAREALAQPEPEGRPAPAPAGGEVDGPSLEEVEELCEEHCFNVEGYESIECLQGLINDALARYGRPASAPAGEVAELVRQLGSMAADAEAADYVCDATVLDLAIKHLETLNPSQPVPPAEGEVADLAEFLRIYGDHVLDEYGDLGEHDQLTRAADLLERQAAPVPVAVSEHLPGAEDCLDEGWAWFFSPRVGWRQAVLPVSAAYTHWLPANALPIPEQGDH